MDIHIYSCNKFRLTEYCAGDSLSPVPSLIPNLLIPGTCM